jgi:DNA-binding transcriptional regulator GbsR (MarR family)
MIVAFFATRTDLFAAKMKKYVDEKNEAIEEAYKEEDKQIRDEMEKMEERHNQGIQEVKDQVIQSHEDTKEWIRLLMENK